MKNNIESNQEEEKIIKWINSLNDNQLVQLFYKVTTTRGEKNEYSESRWVIALASKYKTSPNWRLQNICLPDPNKYPGGWVSDAPFCQAGSCCGHETLSIAKHGICPICKKEVYGT